MSGGPEAETYAENLADPLTRTLLALTFVTGIVDAITFLELGQVFAAMQTGNVIFLGLGISGTAGTAVAAPLVALGSFLLGGAAATLLVRRRRGIPQRELTAALALEASLLAGAAAFAALTDPEPDQAAAYALIGLLGLTMGLRNTVARREGGPNLATTVLNLTLTPFTAHSPLAIAPGSALEQRGAALIAILAGAVAGGLMLKAGLVLPLGAAATIAGLAAMLAD